MPTRYYTTIRTPKALEENTNTLRMNPPWRCTNHDSKKIYTTNNIINIPTPTPVSPHLQVLNIVNKLLTPFLIMNLYMTSQPQDLNPIPDIILQINILIKHHPTYKTIFARDFNGDIFLQGHIHEGTPQTITHKDREWARHMQTLNIHPIQNIEILSQQGGQNYSSTSLIDGLCGNPC